MENEEKKATVEDNSNPGGLNLGDSAQEQGGGADYGRLAELERELQSQKVENGRAKALAKRVKELEEENRRLAQERDDALSRNKDYLSEIPEDMRDQVDPVQVKAFGRMLDRRMSERRDEEDAWRRKREAEAAREREEDLLRKIEQSFPGFLRDTQPGGDKYDAWMKFLKDNGDAVKAAYANANMSGLSTLFNAFLSQAGVQTRGASLTETPRPTSVAIEDIANPNGPRRTYTQAEYASLLDEAGTKVRSGKISRQDYERVREELSRAREEGRIR